MNPQDRKQQNLTATYEALLQLMSQKPLTDISITELCQHAHVSRTYFYRNFTSFDQIILAYQEQAMLEYLHKLPHQSQLNLSTFMTHYFTLMQQMASTNQLLINNGKLNIIIESFQTVNTLLLKQERIPKHSKTIQRPYYLAYFSGAVVNVLTTWLQNGMVETPQYLGQLVASFATRQNHSDK
ncbi:TetR/AcrR family transcriptional regulator [Lactiplantibacillus herbarum]|uniref:TetR/AcrR family transcriptional regulator n=1 Tax=Lactiplantibacillus herbarum TaxID=1670446 RepID=UPI00064E6B49|nr:TetR/AcrR family transcriptional regulator [Lactiplantibacillus herbarum]